MTRQRVQVRDLEAPERIQPAPVQSDTYARPAPPPIDNSLEQLQKGLAMFGSAATALGEKQKAEDEKRIKTEQLAAYEAWKASVSSDEHLYAIRSGKLPITVDRILDSVVKKDGAVFEAQKIAEEIDATLPTAGLGSSTFDPDGYVRGIAAPYVSRISRDPRAMAYLGDHLDRLRAGVTRRHEEVRGQLQTQYMQNRGKQEIALGIENGAKQGWNGQRIMDALRNPDPKVGIYAAIGPRKSGGALDLSYAEHDKLTLDVAEKMAEDPERVGTAIELITAQRKSVDGSIDLGPLANSVKHSAKIDTIKKKATKTIGDATEAAHKARVDAVNLQALERGGGTFSTITDYKGVNPGDPSRRISYSADAQREATVDRWIQQRRADLGRPMTPADFDAEIDFLMDRGIQHPEFKKVLNEGFTGFLSSTSAGTPAADRIPEIVRLGNAYTRIAERNPAFAQELVSPKAREFYDAYRILLRYERMDPDKAATAVAVAFSTPEGAQDPQVVQGNLRSMSDRVDSMDLKKWWPGGGVVNHWQARAQLKALTKTLARFDGRDINTILDRAAESLSQNSAYVNGRMVMSPGIAATDAPHVEHVLSTVYKDHAKALEAQGVSKASNLSIVALNNNTFTLINATTGDPLKVPLGYDKDGNPTGIDFYRFSGIA